MKDIVFNIEELNCAYPDDREKVVLQIKHLAIPKGKIVFFVGPSGIGKSTILETLGLMNNTILSVKEFTYSGLQNEDLSHAWKWKDEKLSSFRCKEYSFIFQQTNLMPNFSAYENVMSTAMFQNIPFDIARRRTIDVFKQMGLPTDDRPIFKYSGGQQQRIAFARAIMPDYNVLFGDEPTGNLDPKSADNLMQVLYDAIHSKNATAIIVSHDMHLAVTYADEIVCIRKEETGLETYGVIDQSCIYNKEGETWYNENNTFSTIDLQNKLTKEL